MIDPINDIDNYRWSVFYFNKNDHRIIVPKRTRAFGWTLNFARVESWIMLISLLGLVFLLSYYGSR